MHAISLRNAIDADGFALIPAALPADVCRAHTAGIATALEQAADDPAALRRRGGLLYGARNLLELYPATCDLWRTPMLLDVLQTMLGKEAGLVRALFFDKPPEATWSLPWHQDRTIAVKDNHRPSTQFVHPTNKAGVPHVEAPHSVLEQMLTLRIHLDAATTDNGPLQVLPGSHRSSNENSTPAASPVTIFANVGDTLAMRPLLSHCSGVSTPGTNAHRRIIHLEFAAHRQLPDGFEWYRFIPV